MPEPGAPTTDGRPPSSARVELLDAERAPLLVRHLWADGDPGPIVAALAQVPELVEATLAFVGAALGPSAVDARTKELVILRTSAMLSCRYCVDAHTVVALDTGLGEDEVRALRGELDVVAVFGDGRERALLRWVDAVATGRGPIPDQVAADAGNCFADHEMVELAVLVGATMLLNRFCTSLELATSPDVTARLVAGGWRR